MRYTGGKEKLFSPRKEATVMSEQVTKKDFQEFSSSILEAINSMYTGLSAMMSEKIERSENSMKAYIENSVEKQAKLNGERINALTEKVEAMEEHLGKLTQDAEQVKMDIHSIRAALEEHDNEIFMLSQAK